MKILYLSLFCILLGCQPSQQEQNTQSKASPQELTPFAEGGLWGYTDQDKNIIISPRFEEAEAFEQDSAVFDGRLFRYASVKQNGKYGAINEQGTLFIPAEYTYGLIFHQGFAMSRQGEEAVIVNYKNQKIFSTKKFIIMFRGFSEGLQGISLAAQEGEMGYTGFIDYEGKVVIPFVYDMISPVNEFTFENGRVAISKNGLFGILDKTGKEIYPFSIPNASPMGHRFDKDQTGYIYLESDSVLVISAEGKLLRKEKQTER